MSGKSLEELIDGEVDGTNTPLESARLREWAAREPAAAERLEAHRRAAAELAGAAREESPAGLAEAVMREVRQVPLPLRSVQPLGGAGVMGSNEPLNSVPALRRRISNGEGGGSMSKSRKVLWGVAAAAVIAIGYFAVRGIPPVGPGAEGTIGAAKRYQSEQIAAKDVAVEGAAVQAFLQSESFDQLVRNPAARKALADDKVRAALASPGVAAALSNADLAAALSRAEVQAALANPAIRSALASPDLAAALASPEMKAALASPELKAALASPEIRAALGSAEMKAALASPEARAALQGAELRSALASAEVRSALASADLRQALGSAEFRAALASADLRQALGSAEMKAALASADLRSSN
jgi:hypothetical protein